VNIITVFCGQHDQRLEFFFGSKLKVPSFERKEKAKKKSVAIFTTGKMWTLQRSTANNSQTAAKESLANKSFTLQRFSNVQRDNYR
jgi:hypothetical protein